MMSWLLGITRKSLVLCICMAVFPENFQLLMECQMLNFQNLWEASGCCLICLSKKKPFWSLVFLLCSSRKKTFHRISYAVCFLLLSNGPTWKPINCVLRILIWNTDVRFSSAPWLKVLLLHISDSYFHIILPTECILKMRIFFFLAILGIKKKKTSIRLFTVD